MPSRNYREAGEGWSRVARERAVGEPGGDRQLGQRAPEGHAWDFGLTLTEQAAAERFRAEAWQVLAYVLTGSPWLLW